MNWLIIAGAFLGGMVVAGLVFVLAMRKLMLEKEKVEGSFEEVCERVEEAVESTEGWGMPLEPADISEKLRKRGEGFDTVKRIRNYHICKAPYAAKILDEFAFVSAMMPCSWTVFELKNGDVYLGKMNIGLMSKVFAGNTIGQVMSKVGNEEEEMAREVIEA